MEQNTNVFTLLDNFFGQTECPPDRSILRLSGQDVDFLGEHIRQFYDGFIAPARQGTNFRAHFGSYLSGNLEYKEHSEYLYNGLLYCHEVLVPCPLHDWFSTERLHFPQLFTAKHPFGFYIPDEAGKLTKSIFGTKLFLIETLPTLYRLRPLIDSGNIILFPHYLIWFKNREEIHTQTIGLFKNEVLSPELIKQNFSPADITVDLNKKGQMTLAGPGIFDQNVLENLQRAVSFFLSDFVASTHYGGSYSAAFSWEHFLLKKVIQSGIEGDASFQRNAVIEAVYNTSIPYLRGLRPDTIVKIHSEVEFQEFRSTLLQFYGVLESHLFTREFPHRLREIEEDIVRPQVLKVEKALGNSIYERVLRAFKEGSFRFTETYLSAEFAQRIVSVAASPAEAITLGIPSLILRSLAAFLKSGSGLKGSHKIWATLIRTGADDQPQARTNEKAVNLPDSWKPALRGQPPLITAGTWLGAFPAEDSIRNQYENIDWTKVGRNQPCPCRSGKKYKSCCGLV